MITDKMIEAAIKGFWGDEYEEWILKDYITLGVVRDIKAALEAAESVRGGEAYDINAHLTITTDFIEELTKLGGKYPEANGTNIVLDAYKVLREVSK